MHNNTVRFTFSVLQGLDHYFTISVLDIYKSKETLATAHETTIQIKNKNICRSAHNLNTTIDNSIEEMGIVSKRQIPDQRAEYSPMQATIGSSDPLSRMYSRHHQCLQKCSDSFD